MKFLETPPRFLFFTWVVNNSLLAARPRSPFLRARAHSETDLIGQVTSFAPRTAVVPLLAEEPVGVTALAALTKGEPARHSTHTSPTCASPAPSGA